MGIVTGPDFGQFCHRVIVTMSDKHCTSEGEVQFSQSVGGSAGVVAETQRRRIRPRIVHLDEFGSEGSPDGLNDRLVSRFTSL